MSRFVVISDLHLHPWSAFAKGDGLQNTRLQRSLQVLDASLKRAQEEDIPWIFAGDLVHTAGYSLNFVLSGAINVLSRYPDVPKITVWGNHDARGIGGKITLEQTVLDSVRRAVPNLWVLDQSDPSCLKEIPVGSLRLCGGGYQPRAELLDLGPGGDIGIFHQTVRNSITGTGFTLDEGIPAEWLTDRYRVAIVGHVHHPQEIDGVPGHQAVLIPGSPEHHNFGDTGEHGWWILSMNGEVPSVEFVPGGSPEFKTVTCVEQVQSDGHFYRINAPVERGKLPENTTVVAPSPTTVQQRDALQGISDVEQILQVWLKENPPEHKSVPLSEYITRGRLLLESQDPVRMRPMRLKQLTLHNFCSFELAGMDVLPGVFLVTGKGRDFPSNGAGKTTLVGEALYWLIFGKNTKGLAADEVIRWDTDECSVTATLVGHSTLVVQRRRGKNPGLDVVEDGEPWEATSVDAMTDKLTRFLGLTPEIYQNLGYFSQEKIKLFSSATDGERKDVLADLIGLSAYQQASAAASQHVTKLEAEVSGKTARADTFAGWLLTARSAVQELEAAVEQWEKDRKDKELECAGILDALLQSTKIISLRTRADELNKKVDFRYMRHSGRAVLTLPRYTVQFRDELIGEAEVTLSRLREAFDVQFEKIKQRFGDRTRAESLVATIPATRTKITAIESELTSAKTTEAEKVRKLDRLLGQWASLHEQKDQADQAFEKAATALGQGVCPFCQQPITELHKEQCLSTQRQYVAEIGTKLGELGSEIERMRDAVAAAAAKREAQEVELTQYGQLLTKLQDAERMLAELRRYEQEIAGVRKQNEQLEKIAEQRAREYTNRMVQDYLSRNKARVGRAQQFVREEERKHQDAIKLATEERDRVVAQINPHIDALQREQKRVEELDTQLTTEIKQLEQVQDQITVYEYWKKGFSKQGIQSLLVEEIAALFNATRVGIFPVLTQGVYDVQFSTVSRTKSGEPREKTEFLIFEHGEPIPYGALSGGQRRRVDLGIMLTLVQAVSKWMDVPGILGVLTLDEVFGFLDQSGAEGLLDALHQLQEEQIPTIFAVSHDAHLQSLFPSVIQVEQDANGISRIVS